MSEEFAAAFAELEQMKERHGEAYVALQEEWKETLRAEFRRHFPKRRVPQAYPKLCEATPDAGLLFAWFKGRSDTLYEANKVEEEAMEARLKEIAVRSAIPPTPDLHMHETRSSGHYSSQGWGAAKYARESIQMEADEAIANGLIAEVRETRRERYSDGYGGGERVDYGLFVNTTKLGWEMTKRKPAVSLRDWIKSCWKRGVNPRVFNPFLPHGIEEKLGVSYFGDDIKAPAVAQETAG